MLRFKCLAVAMFSSVLGMTGADDDPLTGIWKLNLTKSRLPSPLPLSQTGRIEVQGQRIHIREDVVNGDGKSVHIIVDAKFDGKYYPVTGTPFADFVAYRRLDTRTIAGQSKKDGKVVSKETVVLAPDGRSMTVTYTAKRGGKTITSIGIFDKE